MLIKEQYQHRKKRSINLEVILLACSTFIMGALIFFIPVIPILVHLSIWFIYFLYKQNYTKYLNLSLFIVSLITLWSVFSFFWSKYPSITLYYSVEYLLLSITSLIISNNLAIEDILKGIILGMFLTMAYSFQVDLIRMLSGTYYGYGIYGSKNQIAMMAQISLLTITVYYIQNDKNLFMNFISILALILVAFYMINNNSATVYFTTIVVISMSMLYYILIKIKIKYSVLLIIAIILYALSILIALASLGGVSDIFKMILNLLGKDVTLTGRTYLWAVGIEQGMKSPFLGLGYSSFWVPGNPVAEELWRMNGLENTKTGFHFHNLFIGWFVELGFVGLFLLFLSILLTFIKLVIRTFNENLTIENTFIFCFFFVIIMRSFSEMDIIGPFGIMPLLYFMIIGILYKK